METYSGIIEVTEPGDRQFKCFNCDILLSSDLERAKHRKIQHPDNPLDYSNPEDLAS
jgi:hypothetical protein